MYIVTVSIFDLAAASKLVGYDKLMNNQCGVAVKLKVSDDDYEKIAQYAFASEFQPDETAKPPKQATGNSAQ